MTLDRPSVPPRRSRGVETVLTHLGRNPADQFGYVNTPVHRGSTILFPDLETMERRDQRYTYPLAGSPNMDSVASVLTELEGGAGTRLVSSGLVAITCALQAVLSAGDEVLVTDSIYEPTRHFCDNVLARMGITTRYFDPRLGAKVSDLFTDRTRVLMLESPGSLTFEVQDLPAISAARGDRNISIIVDNTWATPLFYRPLELGANISVHAGTKMIGGHSDIMLGTITADEAHLPAIVQTHRALGLYASPDDSYLAARGLRTLKLRMDHHHRAALDIAEWLEGHDLVSRVLHPGLPSHPDHEVFRRDFSGSGSLFAFELAPAANRRGALAAMLDGMELFGMGYSWGGFESLIVAADLSRNRTATKWEDNGPLIRIHIGLETPEDLMADLSEGLERYRAAMG